MFIEGCFQIFLYGFINKNIYENYKISLYLFFFDGHFNHAFNRIQKNI